MGIDTLLEPSGVFAGFIIFEIGGWDFCLDINNVSTIIPRLQNTSNHEWVDNFDGFVKYNDAKIRLIKFHQYCEVSFADSKNEVRLIIIQSNHLKAAFPVERIKGFISLKGYEVQAVNAFKNIFLKGKINYDGKEFLFPDIDRILTDALK